jgi:hypothetical protein
MNEFWPGDDQANAAASIGTNLTKAFDRGLAGLCGVALLLCMAGLATADDDGVKSCLDLETTLE